MTTACLLVHVADAGVDASAVADQLEGARTELGGGLLLASDLLDVDDDRPVLLVATRAEAHDDLDRFTSGLPAGGSSWRCGIDADVFGALGDDALLLDGIADPDAPGCYVEVVLDPTRPPVPFDDPAILQILRDEHQWYTPLIGPAHIACAALWWDGVRAAGCLHAFRAPDDDRARWLAAADPWRRVAPGRLLRCADGLFAQHPAPAGPGTQRTGTFACPGDSSRPEPGTAAR